MTVAIAILAAGRGRRMGGSIPKPLVLWQGQSLIEHALAAALASSLRPVYVVLGYAAELIAPQLPACVRVITNPHWQDGLASSLRAALLALSPNTAIQAVCVGLADQPRIGAAAYERLQVAFGDGAALAVATYGGQRRNPVLLGRSLWPDAVALQGDSGARQLMVNHAVTEVPCDDTGDPRDLDTPEALSQFFTY